MSDPTIYLTWNNFITDPTYSKYFIDNNIGWNNTLAELKTYLDTNNKRPRVTSKDPEIKTLGSWVGTQITNYAKKKHIMSDPEIHLTWTAFITHPDYKQYFK